MNFLVFFFIGLIVFAVLLVIVGVIARATGKVPPRSRRKRGSDGSYYYETTNCSSDGDSGSSCGSSCGGCGGGE